MSFFRKNKYLAISFLLIFSFSLLVASESVKAVIFTEDMQHIAETAEGNVLIEKQTGNDSWLDTAWKMLKKTGSKALSSALRNALNKIAYDTATYIGSGGRGQKPLFIREGWGTYLGNIGDEAAGDFVEGLGRGVGPDGESVYKQFNLCQPNLDVQMKIGMGLKEQYRPSRPVCTFSEMKNNWENELDRPDFLYRFKNMFNPGGNDLLQAFAMHANIIGSVDLKEKMGEKERAETDGWLDVRNLAGERISPPNQAEREAKAAKDIYAGNIGSFTGDAMVDASNVFLNQLAITAFQTAMRKLGEDKGYSTSPYDWSSLTNFEAGPSYGGIAGTKDRLNNVIEPKFSVRGDYNILSELTMCPDPTKAGPTNCVITDRFMDAVSDKLTLHEAIEQGYLNGDMVFGFKSTGIEPNYNEGLPYRSMIILRKFRIIPLTWELAAQYIKGQDYVYSLKEVMNCYKHDDEYGPITAAATSECLNIEDLVDPNWVLKAPLNYCRREGPGPEIAFEKVTGVGKDSKLAIFRNENYCADEQACIDENDDGSCNIYGYCTEENRKWSFGTKSCEPKYNTCQTFMDSTGAKVSYLKNTLDYADCSVDNAGCAEYFTESASFSSTTNNIIWRTNTATDPVMYFDRDASRCSDKDEGCTQLIRTKEGLGANLLPNSSFEDTVSANNFEYWGTLGLESSDSLDGYIALQLTSAIPFSRMVTVGPNDYSAAGDTYTLSVYTKDCTTGDILGLGDGTTHLATTSIDNSNQWSVYRVQHSYPSTYTSNQIEIFFDITGTCLIDSIKLEKGPSASRYSNYMDTGVVYEKLIPEYLYNDCYENPNSTIPDYRLKNSRPLECDNFSRLCNVEEVGCSMYTSIKDNIGVPAKIGAQDYCPDVCVGYDSFIQAETSFDSLQNQFFIPRTAKACSAQYVGCDEFTNLDKIEEAGESREYYTSLKQCIKPTDPMANCGEYYTWEGSKETGYQLKVFSLQNSGAGGPDVTSNDSTECSIDIFYASSTSPLYNPDCREYYAKDGNVYYHLNSRTITCSDNCHPYRRSDDNVVRNMSGLDYTAAQCGTTVSGGTGLAGPGEEYGYDTDQNYCVKCINGGVWNSQHNACIYMAIPDEGKTCMASQDACREYGGSSGNNTRLILNTGFEGSVQGWEGGIGISNESLMVGGNSLFVSGASPETSYVLGTKVREGSAYVINFLAKGDGSTSVLTFNFENSNGTSTLFSNTVTLNINEWGIYEINLLELDHKIDGGEKLVITGTNDFYIDDVRLTNIRDRYYLVKNSWVMPEVNGVDICNWDIINDLDSPLYSLSCEQYTDIDNTTHSLRGFTNLCQESAVGCEVMIDTQNSDNYNAESLPGGAVIPQVNVPADEYIYAVYSEDKLCDSVNKGCQRMGKGTTYEGQILTQDFYIKNNPSEYDKTICSAVDTECQEWSVNEGLEYFKDPVDHLCEWKQGPETLGGGWGWYKKEMKRCDINGDEEINTNSASSICLFPGCVILENTLCYNDNDCAPGIKCMVDKNVYNCTTDSTAGPVKTLGKGGYGNKVEQPALDSFSEQWTGVCPASQSTCTEYIDPMSRFSTNMIFNSDFSQDINGDLIADGWESFSQEINLKANTLYSLITEGANTGTFVGSSNVYQLDDNNILNGTSNIIVNSSAGQRHSELFYTYSDLSGVLNVLFNAAGGNWKVELRKVVIDYRLKDNFEYNDCNGLVNFEDGCVLFNERSVSSGNTAVLGLDADLSFYDGNGVAPSAALVSADNDSNILLKVRPDRECGEWLACKSYIKNTEGNDICYDIGLCDSFDDNGNCNDFVVNNIAPMNQIYNTGNSDFADKSGYAKAAFVGMATSFEEPNDYYELGDMEQVGNVLSITNGDFETYSSDGYPISWSNSVDGDWIEQNYKIINNPVEAQNEGIGRNPEGNGFLRLGPDFILQSGFIDISQNTQYVLSANFNTIKMDSGSAQVYLEGFDVTGFSTGSIALSQLYGEDWKFKTLEFTTPPKTTKMVVSLKAGPGSNGNFYFDDIKIKAALKAKDNYYVAQECRLYPDSNSLSCEYTEDSGAKKKGWSGYCLEHDVYPGNSDACLLWWPVDNVKGEGDIDKDNYGGYFGKTPVYFCDDVGANVVPVEARKRVYLGKVVSKSSAWGIFKSESSSYVGSDACPSESGSIINSVNSGYYIEKKKKTKHGKLHYHKKTTIKYYCVPMGPVISSGYGYNWYEYNGNLVNIKGADHGGHNEYEFGVKLFDLTSGKFFDTDDYQMKCRELHKVVTEDGQNKAWNGRVYSGSDYRVAVLDYQYSSDDAPFGSMVIPDPVHNPYEWDGDSRDGNQAIPFIAQSSNKVRTSSPYDCTGVTCQKLGYCSVTGDLCLDVPQNILLTNDGVKYPECGTKTESTCYYNWNQDFLPCPSGESCLASEFNVEETPKPTAYNNEKRLFAKSYGSWEWSPSTGHCTANPAIPCTAAGNPCPGGNCSQACTTIIGGEIEKDRDDEDGDGSFLFYDDGGNPAYTSDRFCVSTTECQNTFRYEKISGAASVNLTLSQFNTGNVCNQIIGVTGIYATRAAAINDNCCTVGVGEDECTSAERTECEAYYNAITATDRYCSITLNPCVTAADCLANTTCGLSECTGGSQAGHSCNTIQVCSGDNCLYEEKDSGRYEETNSNMWDVPTHICGTNPRPAAFNSGYSSLSDYCAIVPIVNPSDIKVNTIGVGTVILKNGDIANLTFTSKVERNQEPLVGYSVFWDGYTAAGSDSTVVSGIKMNSKPNPDRPHSVYHLYSYYDLRQKQQAGAPIVCGDDCSADTIVCGPAYAGYTGPYCIVRPLVQIRDNWGWCNHGNNTDSCPVGAHDQYLGNILVTPENN